MSNISKSAALLLACFFALNLHAQTISDADRQGIETTYKSFAAAFDQLDATAMGPLFTENAEVVTPRGEIVRGRASLVTMYTGLFNYFKSLPRPDRSEREILNRQEHYLAKDLILVSYTEVSTGYYGDKQRVDKMAQSILLRKNGDTWLAELVALTPVMEMPAPGGN
jgi:ketosteroid isomerase-like protein